MTPTAKRRLFRELLAGSDCLHPASVADPLSLRAAQDIGYEVAMLAGSVASLAVLGAPDVAVLTLGELAEQARRICRAGDIPLLVDGDHGYGNALNVRRTVEELEAAGAAAVTIEDTVLPAPFGGKVRAALDARNDEAFVVVGRTSAALAASQQDLLDRQAALQEAGADAVFVTGVKTLQLLDVLGAAARVPLILSAPVAGAERTDLAERNVRLCLQGHRSTYDAVEAAYRRLYQMRTGQEPPQTDARTLVKQLSRAEDYARWERCFLA
jgi:carboxyvinyl-carboxyphosphonate phosphorylmutase